MTEEELDRIRIHLEGYGAPPLDNLTASRLLVSFRALEATFEEAVAAHWATQRYLDEARAQIREGGPMNGDVTIPADVAKDMAAYYRRILDRNAAPTADPLPQPHWADLLDPKPPTLRESLIGALRANGWTKGGAEAFANEGLPVIADEMEKRPRIHTPQREADVAWLRGEQS